MLKHVSLAAILTISLAAPALAATAAATPLTPDEIKTTFATGKPFTAVSPGGKSYTLTLNADGTAVRAAASKTGAKAKGKGETGAWRVSDKGYCTTWGKRPEHCYTVQKSGDGYDILGPAGKAAHWKL